MSTKKRFIGKSGGTASKSSSKPTATNHRRTNEIPAEIRENKLLNELIKQCLPPTYNFELHKTIHQVIQNQVSILGLQMPEGLLQFSLTISDIIRKFCPDCQDVVVLGDVTYGACCVDDLTAKALGCQMLIHYGHSCLIPVDQTSIKTLYVFVEIGIDSAHLAETIRANFPGCMHEDTRATAAGGGMKHVSIEHEETPEQLHLAVVGTVQFVSAVQALKSELEQPPRSSSSDQPSATVAKQITDRAAGDDDLQPVTPPEPPRFRVTVPQIKPLSPGEILGCTAPRLSADTDAILYLGDGRFHLESIMIANPSIPAFRYDPYEKKITREGYDHVQMRRVRASAIALAGNTLASPPQPQEPEDRAWAVVLGTLGRQGSLSVLKSITSGLRAKAGPGKLAVPLLISEISAAKLGHLTAHLDVCVQTSCPRLSIDWGHDFLCHYPRPSSATGEQPRVVPLLNPYEAKVALGQAPGFILDASSSAPTTAPASADREPLLDSYPMDFYADQSLGDWTPRHGRNIRPVRPRTVPPVQ
ncbi:hypothetical protein PTTG_08227 [Puccinia triticina 1-1 BBBD Race 1]|uniref:2-(3-amino-3-carboxypropyl)histidine synthase subunit 1 n=2 Tax=Puccinia triticina TaxID=208348 RepID=A0A180GF19_PUCT1|nr:uncharacterized protein PtA15_16A404 [Puccinia triticina]OAV91316.1 hypothetical protein PTTG_08227 [Puccinia triticina 1-1 BBBD Race 1]WAQ92496.1 hypothetical protein PtA15_16A404 [Puccinia triticina]WAR64241.1 hypothetical protein PtB15_16B401 [Puccinia triticina]